MTGKNRYVLDSYALIGYLENEPFAGLIEDLLRKAKKGNVKLYLHALQLGEVYYITLREQGKNVADSVYLKIKNLPLTFINHLNEKLLLTAASLKANYPISYADAFAAALAKLRVSRVRATLLTGDYFCQECSPDPDCA